MTRSKRQSGEIHPNQVFTPSQVAPFLGCSPRNAKRIITPAWWDGGIPKFLGKDVLQYQAERAAAGEELTNKARTLLQRLG